MRPLASVRVTRCPATNVRVRSASGMKCPSSRLVRNRLSSLASSSSMTVRAHSGAPVRAAVPMRVRSDGCTVVDDKMDAASWPRVSLRRWDPQLRAHFQDKKSRPALEPSLTRNLSLGCSLECASNLRPWPRSSHGWVRPGRNTVGSQLGTGPVAARTPVFTASVPERTGELKWALGYGLFFQARRGLDGLYSRCVYLAP